MRLQRHESIAGILEMRKWSQCLEDIKYFYLDQELYNWVSKYNNVYKGSSDFLLNFTQNFSHVGIEKLEEGTEISPFIV